MPLASFLNHAVNYQQKSAIYVSFCPLVDRCEVLLITREIHAAVER
jgi:hypothetical protein